MASGKSATFENDILLLILNATAITGLAENHSSPNANVYVSLHTTTLSDASDQTSGECDYTGYGRVAVARTSGGWTVATGTATNTADITFGACTAGSNTATDVAIGTDSSGAGKVLWWGALDSSLAISSGITPKFSATNLDITEE